MFIPIVFSPGFSKWKSHSHFVRIRYTIGGPIGRNVVSSHLRVPCPIVAAHPTCIFLSLLDDTHIIGPASNVVLAFYDCKRSYLY
jgi:hypothetical protein